MIPKIIHIIYVGTDSPLSEFQNSVVQTARELHPNWEVKVWRDPVSPDGFLLAKYWKFANSGAQLADMMRIDVINLYGGVYIDSDVMLKKPLDDLVENTDFFISSEDGEVPTNAVFGASPAHPAINALIENLLNSPPDWSIPPNVTTGPSLFARVLKWRKDITLLPRESFYPYAFQELRRPAHLQAHGEHIWAGSWMLSGRKFRWKPWLSEFRPRKVLRRVLKLLEEWRLTNQTILSLTERKCHLVPCTPQMIRNTIHGHSLLLDGDDLLISPQIAMQGYYEIEDEMFLRRALRGGDFFLDVGANVGVFALLAASLVGPFGRVFAYEPQKKISTLLKKSAAMNHMHERVQVREVAVGSAAGQVDFIIYEDRPGTSGVDGSGHIGNQLASASKTKTTVSVVTLDDEFPFDIPIRMLKIDAEGFEADVLRGASRLISNKCVDYILLEAIEEASGERWNELIDVLKDICSKGYVAFSFKRSGRLTKLRIDDLERKRIRGRNIALRSVNAIE